MPPAALTIEAKEEVWPLKEVFRISRGSRTETRVIVVTVKDGEHIGRGECVPIARYNQSCASVIEQIEPIKRQKNLNRQSLQKILPAGAARNAVDCALWDLEAKRSGKRVWELANIPIVDQVETSFTISLDTPDKMAAAAKGHLKSVREHDGTPGPLKLKLYGGDDADLARVKAVHAVAPNGGLIIDANESWSIDHYRNVVPALKDFGVELIEQPFPADRDEVLEALDHPVPVCADESCHTSADVSRLKNRYDILNVKLDKTGGLSEALRLVEAARANEFKLLIGCMVGTSLGMAPARIFATADDYVDLDGPLLLARDRESGLNYRNGKIGMPNRELWG
jgi:L-alanine-DL-glutamate epimerase-like enolase superfamily enzyme